MMRLNRFKAIVAGIALVMLGSHANAAEYPDRGIKITVAWTAGGGTDIVGRFVADQLTQVFKQPVVVENRAGANGNLGAEAFIKLPADGYSLMVATAETHAINAHVYKKLGYDGIRDFDTIALLARVGFVLATRADLPAKTVAEFLALAKTSPGKISVGSFGIGSTSHLTLAAMEEATGASFLHVPYRGVAPAVNALLTGEIDAAFVGPNSVASLQKNGQVKILGAASLQRLPTVPDVPTFAEQGYKDFVGGNWYGIVAPKGTPPEVKKRLQDEVRKIALSETFSQRMAPTGLVVDYLDASQFSEFIQRENEKWSRTVTSQKIEVAQ